MFNTSNKIKLIYVLFIALGFSLYTNVLNGAFQFDDYPVIVDNEAVKDTHALRLFNARKTPSRFLVYATFALNYYYHQLDVFGYHLVNVVIHIATAMLLFHFILLLLSISNVKDRYNDKTRLNIACLSALLFLVHPLQTQAVSYITQRFALMGTFFYLLTLYFYLKARYSLKRKYFVYSVCALLGGVFSKQIIMTVPLMIVMLEWICFPKDKQRKFSKRFLLIALATVLLIPVFYRFNVSTFLNARVDSGSHHGDTITWGTYLLTQPRVILTYLKLFFVPWPQNLLYDFDLSKSLFDPRAFFSAGAIGALIYFAIRFRSKNPLISFGVMWFFVALLVESSVIPIRHVIFEHRLYLPSVGLCLLVSVFISQRVTSGIARNVLIICLITGLGFLTVKRNEVWKDPISMWKDVVRKSPNHPKGYYNLGYENLKRGYYQIALVLFSRAIELDPAYDLAYNNRSYAHQALGQWEQAIKDARKTIELKPESPQGYVTKATALRGLKRYKEALEAFSQAIAVDPKLTAAYINRAITYGDIGAFSSAIADLTQAIKLDLHSAVAFTNRGAMHLALNQQEQAISDFTKAIAVDPDYRKAVHNRSLVYQESGVYHLALNDLNRLVELEPEEVDYYSRRAFVYVKLNQFDHALDDYDTLQDMLPENAQLYMEKAKVYFKKNDFAHVIDELTTYIQEDGSSATAYFLRGVAYFQEKKYKLSLADLKRAEALGYKVDQTYFQNIKQQLKNESK